MSTYWHLVCLNHRPNIIGPPVDYGKLEFSGERAVDARAFVREHKTCPDGSLVVLSEHVMESFTR